MQIRIRETGAVVFDNEFRTYAQSHGAVFGAPLTEAFVNQYGGDIVLEGPQASGGTVYQYSQYAGVEQIDGKWYTKYVLGPIFTGQEATDTEPALTAEEQEAAYQALKDAEQAKNIRTTRDQKLADLDWTQGKDIPDSISGPAATLRQALRDVPAQVGFPWEVVWPE